MTAPAFMPIADPRILPASVLVSLVRERTALEQATQPRSRASQPQAVRRIAEITATLTADGQARAARREPPRSVRIADHGPCGLRGRQATEDELRALHQTPRQQFLTPTGKLVEA